MIVAHAPKGGQAEDTKKADNKGFSCAVPGTAGGTGTCEKNTAILRARRFMAAQGLADMPKELRMNADKYAAHK